VKIDHEFFDKIFIANNNESEILYFLQKYQAKLCSILSSAAIGSDAAVIGRPITR